MADPENECLQEQGDRKVFPTKRTTSASGVGSKRMAGSFRMPSFTGSPPATTRHEGSTRLVVIRLDKERSAVIGHAEGANEEADARAMADIKAR
jgi:hypothetical protein